MAKARENFGVVLDPATLKLDREKTEKLREQMRKDEKREVWTPDEPGAAMWVKENIRDDTLVDLEQEYLRTVAIYGG
jgi:hypothetical protein